MDISRKFGKSGNRLEKVEERRKELKTIEKLSMTEIHKLADLALKVISVKVKQLCRFDECSVWANYNSKSENQMGKLQQQRESEF